MGLLFSLLVAALAQGGLVQDSGERVTFEQGQWEMSVELISLEAPTLDERTRQGLSRIIESLGGQECLPSESSDLLRDFQAGLVEGFRTGGDGDCRFDENRAGDGTFATRAVCRATAHQNEVVTEVRGSYTSSSISGDFTITVARAGSSGGPAVLRAEARFSNRRIGSCPATNV